MDALVVNPGYAVTAQSTADLFNRWTDFIEGTPATVSTYTKAVRLFIDYLQENNITEPTRETVKDYRELIKSDHKPSTTQTYIMALKQFFKWTAEESLYPNIAESVKTGVKQTQGHKKDYLTTAQIKRLLQGIDRSTPQGRRDYAVVTLMLTTGLRTIEVARANVADLRPVGDFTALYIQGKGHSEKDAYVKVPQVVEDAIRESLADRDNVDGTESLFISLANKCRGERLTTRSVSRIVKEHLLQAGLNSDRLTAHSLRHTTATLNLLNGGSVEETQQLLRHTNINTTMIYSHALERARNNSEDRVATAIFN